MNETYNDAKCKTAKRPSQRLYIIQLTLDIYCHYTIDIRHLLSLDIYQLFIATTGLIFTACIAGISPDKAPLKTSTIKAVITAPKSTEGL